ncbi:hypothetical protein KTQ96_03620 [Prevotella copri]|uniref:hypothetical protein n=1 Tax=Segatella copri TaxID=165179 RepID=UPI001C2BCB82|nr:hypothetical protein [Segatella copri]MBU9907035.1 hypothetical protein [Segatella copri]MBV3372541.1 hypothetical protein [Segatella copri]
MKRMIIALVAMFMMTFTTASAMSYEQARQQALFLTDKMAYELNLTEDQYEAAYEVNLDYLMSVDTYDDLYGAYWRQRNMDLSYILLDWQYRTYINATYFYRPLYWNAGYWHFGIYARYPRRDYFYFGRPHFYVSYRGGHSWRVNGNRSWYYGRSFGGPHPGGHPRVGMRDGFNRGDYGRGRSFGNMNRENRPQMNPNRGFGNASRPNNNAGFGNSSRPQYGGFGNNNDRPQNNGGFGSNNSNSRPNRGFGSSNSSTSNNRGFGNSSRQSNSSFGSGRSNIFGGNRSGSSMSRSFSSGSGNRSTGGGFTPRSSTPSKSNGGGSFGHRR